LLSPAHDASVPPATVEVLGMSGRVALTERFAKGASTARRKSPIFYDDEVIGFGLQVRDNGRKTFTLDYTVEGRRRRYFISDHPAWSVQAALDTFEHSEGPLWVQTPPSPTLRRRSGFAAQADIGLWSGLWLHGVRLPRPSAYRDVKH
jgi:hypothetical protein